MMSCMEAGESRLDCMSGKQVRRNGIPGERLTVSHIVQKTEGQLNDHDRPYGRVDFSCPLCEERHTRICRYRDTEAHQRRDEHETWSKPLQQLPEDEDLHEDRRDANGSQYQSDIVWAEAQSSGGDRSGIHERDKHFVRHDTECVEAKVE